MTLPAAAAAAAAAAALLDRPQLGLPPKAPLHLGRIPYDRRATISASAVAMLQDAYNVYVHKGTVICIVVRI